MRGKTLRPYYEMHRRNHRIGGSRAMLWTIVPLDQLVDEGDEPQSVAEMSVNGMTVVVHAGADGKRRIERLLSTNPAHYLQPEWQPGMPWPEQGAGK